MSILSFNVRVNPSLVLHCNGFLRFTSGETPADLLMATELFDHVLVHIM